MRQKYLFIFIFFSFLLRLSLIPIIGDTNIPNEFSTLVLNIIHNRGFAYYVVNQENEITTKYIDSSKTIFPSAYMPPAYPYFLAGITSLIRNEKIAVFVIEIIQAILGSLICLLVYQTTKELFNETIAVLSLVISCFYPILAFSSSQISAVILYVFLAQLFLYLVTMLFRETSPNKILSWNIGAGVVLGLLILSRAETVLFAILVIIWLFISNRKSHWKFTAIFVLAIGITISPWVIRNFLVFGELTPLTISGGYNLWQGQNEKSEGTFGSYVVPPVKESEELQEKIRNIVLSNKYEIDRDQIYKDEAIKVMRANPGRVIVLAIRKFFYYWGGVYFGFEMNYPQVHSPLVLGPWFCLLPFFILGLCNSIKYYKKFMVLYLLLLTSTAVSMVFFVLPRYPIFVLPTVIMFSSYGFVIAINWLQKKFLFFSKIDISKSIIIQN
ncbi:glycosyltransferase family 39 protein [Leptolinea tardivitalis]|uniref:Glycosyltransferase RgtA/B/C/D-like domain-containing protein n=1 Tax=Leptolinea tardivitalis TaxID=229920 RepID=A0A0P6X9U4_9CHLR|nr:glycosyltransferase family 39 protein [Leptolinea tardivitalis]KPL71296.1 hypothetical protein ADM99_11370 [Leptolinea tardivitalis]GAP23068.1 4-amino-4-deoxy-L-arabinose transferase [Leptolinea tardivitalis]